MILPLKNRLKAFGSGLLVFIATFFIFFFLFHKFDFTKDVIDRLNGFCYDKLFHPEYDPSKELVIIDLDTTARSVSRKCCAELVQSLQRANTQVIGFDILFAEPRDRQGDDLMIAVSQNYSNVIHSFNLISGGSSAQTIESDLIPFALQRNNVPFPVPRSDVCIRAEGAELPFRELVTASNYMAHINFQKDNDRSIRRVPITLCFGNYIYLSLSLQMVRLFFDVVDDSLELQFESHISEENIGNNYIILHHNKRMIRKIPVDESGQLLIKFVRDYEDFVYYKIKDASRLLENIENGSEINPFENKLVLVVNSKSPGEKSVFSVLNGKESPNWIIHASVISQILKDKYITESILFTMAFSFIIVLLVLLWLVFVEIRLQWLTKKSWLVLSGIGLILIFITFIMLLLGKWPGVILPAIVIYACYFSSKSILHRVKFPPPPAYQDFELQIQEKTKTTYLVDVIKSPAGEEAVGEFTLDLRKLMAMVRKFQETFNPPREKVRDFGTTLFNAIFQEKTKRRYDESLGKIKRSGDRLRIKLRIEPPKLSLLPWEFLYDPERRSHLVLSKELSITRYLLIPQEIEPLEVAPPLKILILISAPSDCTPLQVKNELIKITRALKKLKRRRQIKLDILNKVTVEEFRARIHNYHVIHYIGHGGFVERGNEEIGCLFFENEAGTSELVDAEQLGLLLGNSPVRLVVLNACETAKTSTYDAFLGVAPTLVNAGIPAVIAMQYPIADTSAVIFSEEFYRSLSINYQVDAAMTDAKIAMAARIGVNRTDWSIPVLFMRSPDGVLFRPKS